MFFTITIIYNYPYKSVLVIYYLYKSVLCKPGSLCYKGISIMIGVTLQKMKFQKHKLSRISQKIIFYLHELSQIDPRFAKPAKLSDRESF